MLLLCVVDSAVNQDVLEEICRLSLEISKRIVDKSRGENFPCILNYQLY